MAPVTHATLTGGEKNQKELSDYLAANGWLQACPGFMAVGDEAWLNLDTNVMVTVSTMGIALYRNQADRSGWYRINKGDFFSPGIDCNFSPAVDALVESVGGSLRLTISPEMSEKILAEMKGQEIDFAPGLEKDALAS